MRSRTRLAWLAGVLALLGATVLPIARAVDDRPADGRSPARCGAADTPETGIQGDVPKADQDSGRAEKGYNCGLAVVGHNGFDGASSSSLAWSGNCAYVQGDGVVRVIDVSDATNPVVTTELKSGGSSENIHAVTTGQRAILAATRSGLAERASLVDLFDVRACTSPVLLGTITFPY